MHIMKALREPKTIVGEISSKWVKGYELMQTIKFEKWHHEIREVTSGMWEKPWNPWSNR